MKSSGIALALCCVLFAAPVRAGAPMESYNMRDGLFFTFLGGGEIGFDAPEKMLALEKHCKSGGFIFPFQQRARYKCKVTLSHNMTGQFEGYGAIDIMGAPADPDGMRYALFSTSPPRTRHWQSRPLSQVDIAALSALRRSSGKLDFGKASAIFRAGGTATTFIVPGQRIREEFYQAQRHHVFVETRGVYRYQGRLPDKPVRYYDVDGDSIPEIKTDEQCDGWCKTLWDVSAAPKAIATFGGH